MKTTVAILISSIICFSSYGQNNLQDLKSDKLISKLFEEDDFNSLLTILNLYDSWVIKQTGIVEIDSAYHTFCENAKYNESVEEFILKTKLPQKQLDSIILKCHIDWTFKKLWVYDFMIMPNQIDTFEFFIMPNFDWKYGEFLNELLQEKDILTDYVKSIEAAGDITPSFIYGIPWTHEHFDFKELYSRLFFALHFITANYKVEYYKINP